VRIRLPADGKIKIPRRNPAPGAPAQGASPSLFAHASAKIDILVQILRSDSFEEFREIVSLAWDRFDDKAAGIRTEALLPHFLTTAFIAVTASLQKQCIWREHAISSRGFTRAVFLTRLGTVHGSSSSL